MDFSSSQTFVSLDFGNDEAAFVTGRFFAFLQVFDGATPLGSILVEANGNDKMDQSIALNWAGGFNRVQFSYVDASIQPVRLIEVVDNITYESRINQPVPAPATLALVGAALLGLGAARRRKA